MVGCVGGYRKPHPANLAVEEVINKTKLIIERKYHIRTIDSGASMPNGNVKNFFLDFEVRGPFTKKSLRRILIDSANKLLVQINNNEKVQQFLVKKPFAIEDVQITIFNNSINGGEVYNPEISTAEIYDGILSYNFVEGINEFDYINTYQETYEEALKKLLENDP